MAGESTARLGGSSATFRYRPGGKDDIRNAAGAGVLNVLLYAEERTKAVSVVRGGNRSFLTGSHLGGPLGITESKRTVPRSSLTKAGTVRVGGTLRRSWHAAVFVDGRAVPGSRSRDENGAAVPGYSRGSGIVGYVGSNSGYGGFVDQGTAKMPARPMLMPSIRQAIGAIEGLFRTGWQRFAGGRP